MSWENYFNHNVKRFFILFLFIIQPCYKVILNYNEENRYIYMGYRKHFLWTYLESLDTGMFLGEYY